MTLGDVMTHYDAFYCDDCGFSSGKENCARCGNYIGSSDVRARLCGDCGFGSGKDSCVKCGNSLGSRIPAYLCSDCGFGSEKENCAKCGNWAP